MSKSKTVSDGGAGQVQDAADEQTDQGYIGQKVDPLPNSAHSLESGPDSPQLVGDDRTRAEQHIVGTPAADTPTKEGGDAS